MKGYHNDIEQQTTGNNDFRRVLYTGRKLQLVLMSLPPGCDIGAEVHENRDQFFRFEQGRGQVDIDDLGRLASSWQSAGLWINGDFDYNGTVDVADLGKLASNWQVGVAGLSAPLLDDVLAGLGLPLQVPEPAACFLSLGGLMLLRHRRRR